MAQGNTTTSQDSIIKDLYSDDALENEIFKDSPFLAMIPKFEKSVGRQFIHPVVYGAGQGRSRTFSNALTMSGLTGENSVDFNVTLVQDFAVAGLTTQLVEETKSDAGAFIDAVSLVADDQLQNMSNNLSLGVFGTADGNRGQIASTCSVSGSSLTLTNPKDVLKFEVGMQLDLAAAQTSGNVRAYGSGGHGLYVVAVDYAGCTITVGTTPVPGGTPCAINDATNGIPTAATGDYVYVTGDRNLSIAGFQSWIPYGGVTSGDSFFGVNRSANAVRLAGNYLNGTGGTLEEVLEQAAANVNEVGGSLSHFIMPFKKFADLSKSLGSKAQLVDVKVGQIGFKGIEVAGPRGSIVCMPDRSCPSTMIAGVNIKDWQLNSVGKAVHLWDLDGKVWLRSPSQDGMELRLYSLAQLVCKRPVSQINILVNA